MSWSVFASLLARVSQSHFCTPKQQTARLQLYVDDPLLAFTGTEAEGRRIAVKFVVGWLLLGAELAFSKAQLNTAVTLILCMLFVSGHQIEVSITTDKINDLLDLIDRMLSSNIGTVKSLRAFAGKAMNIATVIFAWRPFLLQFWYTISSRQDIPEQTNAPEGSLWIKQVVCSLFWLRAFFLQESGTIVRTFVYDGLAARMEITADASPWGIGGWLLRTTNPLLISLFKSQIWTKRFLVRSEASVVFSRLLNRCRVAYGMWAPMLILRRARLHMRGDNSGALTCYSALKGRGAGMNLISRDFSLGAGRCGFTPQAVTHLPGVVNAIADTLSRRLDPKHEDSLKLPVFCYCKAMHTVAYTNLVESVHATRLRQINGLLCWGDGFCCLLV